MRALLVFLLLAGPLSAETPLEREIRRIAADARGRVAVACALPGKPLRCGLQPRSHPPMQSVFKLPLGLYALHLVEQGKLALEAPVRFLPSDRILPETYSPLQDKYPDAGVDVPLGELLRGAVSLSDNVAADIVLRVAGGPAAVDDYLKSIGVQGFHLEDGEHGLHDDPAAQYRNWFEPRGAVQLLRLLSDRSPLRPEHTRLLLDWMRDTPTGARRLKAGLPQDAVLMHKTGSSGARNGLAPATNDLGLVVLPDGSRLALVVFVTDSRADEATREAVIARIARAVYAAATR